MTSRSKDKSSLKKADKARSSSSVRSAGSRAASGSAPPAEALDEMRADVMRLAMDVDYEVPHLLVVSFMDQILLSTVVTPQHFRAPPLPAPASASAPASALAAALAAASASATGAVARGSILYDPGDREKMCLFADHPMIVQIRPLRYPEVFPTLNTASIGAGGRDISACNVDISPLITGEISLNIKKRMQPTVPLNILEQKSWENLPLLSMEIFVVRHPENAAHHQRLEGANGLKMSLVGVYNLVVPFSEEWEYVAASRVPMANDQKNTIALFEQGCSISKMPKRFRSASHYESWETMRNKDDVISEADTQFVTHLDDIVHDPEINLTHVYSRSPNTIVWASHHRSLLLDDSEAWLRGRLLRRWPLELHLLDQETGYSFMGLVDATRLLYPGVTSVRVAVPLDWLDQERLQQETGFQLQLTPARRLLVGYTPPSPRRGASQRAVSAPGPELSTPQTGSASAQRRPGSPPPPPSPPQVQMTTGADGGVAFALVELRLQRPLVESQRPQHISNAEMGKMLSDIEKLDTTRACVGRGQSERRWEELMNTTALFLKKTPNYGITDYCLFNRQFVETRTRVEMCASFAAEAAIMINNNFNISDFIGNDETYEELLKLSHACLVRVACEAVLGAPDGGGGGGCSPLLRAARQARQMQDMGHAQDLFLELIMGQKKNGDLWRELATCLLEVDAGWAEVCLKKSLRLNPRHPLTLISLGNMVFNKNPAEAELFLRTVLSLYPQWLTGCAIVQAYYMKMEYFDLADAIQTYAKKTRAEHDQIQLNYPRSWAHELGDWWEAPLLLPGMSPLLDAADLLLRLRCLKLAEVCLAAALAESGDSPAYYQMLALCRRLDGDFEGAVRYVRRAIDKFGEASYLRALEAECLHRMGRAKESTEAFVKAGSCLGHCGLLLSMPSREPARRRPLLVDLLRRQPSAYSWLALADNWLDTKDACPGSARAGAPPDRVACACACALQALRCDRRARPAWLLLAKMAAPPARQRFCKYMANILKEGGAAPAQERYEPSDACRRLAECRCARAD